MSVPALLATPRVLAALRTRLLGDAALVARLADAPTNVGGGPAIYTEGLVPADARTDYLVVGSFTERDHSTMGDGAKWGSELTAMTKLITLSQDAGQSYGTLDRLMALLHGTTLTVEDYASGCVLLETLVDAYEEWVGGKKLLHYPILWRIYVNQAG